MRPCYGNDVSMSSVVGRVTMGFNLMSTVEKRCRTPLFCAGPCHPSIRSIRSTFPIDDLSHRRTAYIRPARPPLQANAFEHVRHIALTGASAGREHVTEPLQFISA